MVTVCWLVIILFCLCHGLYVGLWLFIRGPAVLQMAYSNHCFRCRLSRLAMYHPHQLIATSIFHQNFSSGILQELCIVQLLPDSLWDKYFGILDLFTGTGRRSLVWSICAEHQVLCSWWFCYSLPKNMQGRFQASGYSCRLMGCSLSMIFGH